MKNLFKPKIKIEQCLNGPHPYLMGENNIKIGDKFSGYACGNYFTNQICNNFINDELIIGTTTLVIFNKKNIIKL